MARAFQPYNSDFTILPTPPPFLAACWPTLPPGTLEVRARVQAEPFPGRLDCVDTEKWPVSFPLWPHF